MILFLCVCLLNLPEYCLLQETEELFDDTSTKFVFPKDRTRGPIRRVIGGAEATPHSYPFQAALEVYTNTKSSFCGGTLISPSWILTAAHCLSGDPLYVLVTLGAHDLVSDSSSSWTTLTSTTFVVHEGWNSVTLQNDIGLIKLDSNVSLSTYVATIGYASGNESFADKVGTTIGWGLTETSGGATSAVLRHVDVSILSNMACAMTDENYEKILTPSHLCTSGMGLVGTCNGDSGGPLIVNGLQVGIVSFGSTDCSSGKPSVYTRLTYYSEWIAQHVPENVPQDVPDSCNIYGNFQHVTIVCIGLYLLRQFIFL